MIITIDTDEIEKMVREALDRGAFLYRNGSWSQDSAARHAAEQVRRLLAEHAGVTKEQSCMKDDTLKALAEKATPGPWEAFEGSGIEQCSHVVNVAEGAVAPVICHVVRDGRSAATAAYIVAACNETPKLLARIAALRNVLRYYARQNADCAAAYEALKADDEAQQ